jgi:hypothetical protein
MSKRLILVLTLAFVVGISFAAYAEVQNVKVSGDLTVKGVLRNSLALQDNPTNLSYGIFRSGYGETINAIISTARVRVDADLTDNVSTTVRLLNERVWGDTYNQTYNVDIDGTAMSANLNNDDQILLDLAYVTLKEFLYSPLTLTVGRQELRFGNALIIGDPDTNGISAGHNSIIKTGLPDSLDDLSARKAFDAIRATLNYNPLIVDLVYSKIDENNVQQYDDVDLYGVNAGYAVNKNLNTEVYLWQRTRDSGSISGGLTKPENLRTAGAKAMYTGIKNLFLGLESAFQFGDHAANSTLNPDEGLANNRNRKVTAYAIQAGATRIMPEKKYSPTVGISYTYLSGDKYLSRSDNYRGWDPMFEDQGAGTLSNKISAQSNSQTFNVNGSIKPTDDLTATLNYYYIMLNQPYTSAASAVTLSGVLGDPTYKMKGDKKYFASEVDLALVYDYTEDVQFGLDICNFIPGSAFAKSNRKIANQLIGSMKVTF